MTQLMEEAPCSFSLLGMHDAGTGRGCLVGQSQALEHLISLLYTAYRDTGPGRKHHAPAPADKEGAQELGKVLGPKELQQYSITPPPLFLPSVLLWPGNIHLAEKYQSQVPSAPWGFIRISQENKQRS